MTVNDALRDLAERAMELVLQIEDANVTVVTVDFWDGEVPVSGVSIEAQGKPLEERN